LFQAPAKQRPSVISGLLCGLRNSAQLLIEPPGKLAPLLDGHVDEVLRVSDPALSWLRQVGIAVEKVKRLDEALAASELVDVCQAHSIDFPNKVFTDDLNQLAMYVGRLLGRVFHDGPELEIDRYRIKRESITQDRPMHEGGSFVKTYYRFEKRG
jgi:hypothetical protein